MIPVASPSKLFPTSHGTPSKSKVADVETDIRHSLRCSHFCQDGHIFLTTLQKLRGKVDVAVAGRKTPNLLNLGPAT